MENKKQKPHYIGHRRRMREKFLRYGGRILEDYELLEMLLYNVIPYKDTKPIAKKLLTSFGSLDGVLSAKREELIEIEGVKDRCASFLGLVGAAMHIDEYTPTSNEDNIFENYAKTGEFFLNYFANNQDADIVMLLLNGNMRLISIEKINAKDFGSAAVKSAQFVVPALAARAEVAVIAYTHRYGALFPSEADRATGKMLFEELMAVGITLLEQYIISGEKYVGIGTGLGVHFSAKPNIKSFIDSKEAFAGEY